jgi:hypothetical protein
MCILVTISNIINLQFLSQITFTNFEEIITESQTPNFFPVMRGDLRKGEGGGRGLRGQVEKICTFEKECSNGYKV